jgi:dihydroorotase
MSTTTIIRNARIVNEGSILEADLRIQDGRIAQIGQHIAVQGNAQEIDAQGKYLLPGVIDDQVHFREPGLTHKADIYTESRAAVAGGITSYMEMPNTNPQTLTQDLLAAKYAIGAARSLANYSFFMGAANHNLDEVLKTDPRTVCGIKVFMGSSTGDMLVDDHKVLEGIFRNAPILVATHCEKEAIVRANLAIAQAQYGEDIPVAQHPLIRSHEACYASSSEAVALARAYNTRLHVLHISTATELALFTNAIPLKEKRITAEVCIHHLFFDDSWYAAKGNLIKWNPAVKTAADRAAIWEALLDDRIDIIATDHAPHTLEEKANLYGKAPSGGPLVQHALPVMLRFWQQGKISLEEVVRKMSHAPADCFQLAERGYIREGYWADLVLVDADRPWTVTRDNTLYKCGWSPFEGERMTAAVTHTFVSGHLAWADGKFNEAKMGERLHFER